MTAVLGPNGAGKTTTIEICEGYRRPDAGTVRVLGLDPVARRPAAAAPGRRDAPVRRHPARRPARRVPARDGRVPRPPDGPGLLLDRLGLAGSLRTPFKRLSGGQQQRLSLAAAVIGRPELVFLDEPTAGLDPQARHATWDLIGGLRAAGASVILTTHYMEEARAAGRPGRDRRPRAAGRRGHPGRADRHGRPAQVPGRAGPGHRRRCSPRCRRAPRPRSRRPGTTWSRCRTGWTRSCSPR